MSGQKLALVLRLLGIGWYVALCIGGGAGLGLLLDGRLDTSPLFTLAGIFLGIGIAVIGMYRMLVAVLRAREDQ